MTAGVCLIVIGFLTLAWGRWLLPRHLQRIRAAASAGGKERLHAFFDRPNVRRLFSATGIIGVLVIAIGVVFVAEAVG